MIDRAERRRDRRRASAVRWGLRIAAGLVVFGLGLALGAALHDNPRPGGSVSYVRTFSPTAGR
jgi:hypothetical protein